MAKLILASALNAICLALIVLCSLVLSDPSDAKRSSRPAPRYTAHVITIVDGDTFKGLVAGSMLLRFRLHGIDAPELGQPFGKDAKNFAGDLLYERDVEIVALGRDKRGLTVADVFLGDGRSVSHEMVKAGLAWRDPKYDNKVLIQLEKEARKAKKGLWADAKPVPPWSYRK